MLLIIFLYASEISHYNFESIFTLRNEKKEFTGVIDPLLHENGFYSSAQGSSNQNYDLYE